MVNYFEWSMEYKNTADSIQDVIDRLKAEKRGKSEINKKELDLKIAKYKIYYNECIHISNHLIYTYYRQQQTQINVGFGILAWQYK